MFHYPDRFISFEFTYNHLRVLYTQHASPQHLNSTHAMGIGKVPTLTLFQNVFLEQVQSIDYTGDEVQVTTTDGMRHSAQKVGAGILLWWSAVLRACGQGNSLSHQTLPLAICLETWWFLVKEVSP